MEVVKADLLGVGNFNSYGSEPKELIRNNHYRLKPGYQTFQGGL
jgi:hypothetical protein